MERKRGASPGHSIRVENLPNSVDSYQLRKAFKDFGRVDECVVPEDERGQTKRWGVVQFGSKEAALAAAKTMDRAKFNGREISVKIE